ncbi:hypothetical protein BDR03DRAFT_1014785 [Suillus americanus]|nr:hypothetical protein BDR03DRAFT_1014785 [Suillus americanus]
MSSSNSLQKTEKYPHKKLTLDGSNYSQWATGFKMWAGGIGLWSYVNGDKKELSPPAILTDADQNIICKEKHDKQSDLAALSIASMTVPSTTSMTATATMKGEYKILDAIFVHVLLRALPNYYDPLHQMLVNSDTSLDFSDIVNHLKTQELHHNGTNGTSDHVAMFSGHQGGNASPPKAGDYVPLKGFDKSKGDGWVVGWRLKCGQCLKAGHIWLQCRARLSKDEKNLKSAMPISSPAAIATNMEVSTADQPDANAVSQSPFILTLKEHSANILLSLTVPMGSFHVDSASTAHMEPDISHFAHHTKLHELICVKLADDHVVLAPGWGTVKLI